MILRPRLLDALRQINPGVPDVALEEAVRRVEQVGQPSLVLTNREFHLMLVNGIAVDVMTDDGLRGERVVLVDFDDPDANEFLAVNQVTVKGTHTRRPDIVVFVNGLPLAVIELKNIADEKATIEQAYNQLQTYKAQIPALFHTNELLVDLRRRADRGRRRSPRRGSGSRPGRRSTARRSTTTARSKPRFAASSSRAASST